MRGYHTSSHWQLVCHCCACAETILLTRRVQGKLRGNISKTCRNVFLSRMGVEVMSISLLLGWSGYGPGEFFLGEGIYDRNFPTKTEVEPVQITGGDILDCSAPDVRTPRHWARRSERLGGSIARTSVRT